MNVFVAAAVAFTSAAAASLSILKVIGQLQHSDRLKTAVLSWVTSPGDPRSTLFEQYILIRRNLFGEELFSRQRSNMILAIFCLIWLSEAILALFEPAQTSSAFLKMMMLYPSYHWMFVTEHPVASIFLLAISFILAHASFFVFDLVTLRSQNFGNRLDVYLLLMAASYLLVYLLVAEFAVLVVDTIFILYFKNPIENVNFLLNQIAHAPVVFASDLASALKDINHPEDDSGALFFGLNLGIFGTSFLCVIAMLAASVLNLVFAAALGLTRLDFFIRDALKWNTKDLYENPVRVFIGYCGSCHLSRYLHSVFRDAPHWYVVALSAALPWCLPFHRARAPPALPLPLPNWKAIEIGLANICYVIPRAEIRRDHLACPMREQNRATACVLRMYSSGTSEIDAAERVISTRLAFYQ
jgi:hypothetical protein